MSIFRTLRPHYFTRCAVCCRVSALRQMLKKSSTLREVKIEAQIEASNLHSIFSSISAVRFHLLRPYSWNGTSRRAGAGRVRTNAFSNTH